MHAGEQPLRQHRARYRHQHVGLRVPGVALGAEEFHRATGPELGRRPFDQLVECADAQATQRDETEQPLSRTQRRGPQQQFPAEDGRRHALEEMAEAVVRVACEVEPVMHHEADRHARISVGATEDQDQREEGDQAAGERGERKAASRGDQDGVVSENG